jgi:hypothetical protein
MRRYNRLCFESLLCKFPLVKSLTLQQKQLLCDQVSQYYNSKQDFPVRAIPNFALYLPEAIVPIMTQLREKVAEETDISENWDDVGSATLMNDRLWTPTLHLFYPFYFRQTVKIILMMSAVDSVTNNPRHPECHFWHVPKDIIYVIIQQLASMWMLKFSEGTFKMQAYAALCGLQRVQHNSTK